jgi:hypothetical protein
MLSLRRAECSNIGVPLSVVCLSGIVKSRKRGGTGPLGSFAPWKRKILFHYLCYCDVVV